VKILKQKHRQPEATYRSLPAAIYLLFIYTFVLTVSPFSKKNSNSAG